MKKNFKSMLSGVLALAVSATLISVPFSASAEETASKMPLNYMSVGRHGFTNISWKMPNREDIVDVKLYKEDGSLLVSVDDENIVSADGDRFPLVKDESGYVKLRNRDGEYSSAAGKGVFYTYNCSDGRHVTNIEITYADGTVYKGAAISNKTRDAGKMIWGAPKGVQDIIDWDEAVNETTHVKFTVTKDEKKEGEASLLVRSNQNSAINNTFQQFGPSLVSPLETGKTYRFSYWIKGVNSDWYAVGYGGRWGEPRHEEVVNTIDWQQRTITVTTGEEVKDFIFQFERPYEAIYIDNVELYEWDTEANAPVEGAVNLIANPGFETDITAPADVIDATAALDENGNATISWSKGSDVAYTYVYNEFEGKKNVYRVTEGNSVTIPNSQYGDSYTLVAVDTCYNESAGINVTVNKGGSKIPKNLIYVGRDRSAGISWKMPKREDIADVKLYDADGNVIASVDEGTIVTGDNSENPLVKDNGVVKVKNKGDGTFSSASGVGVYFWNEFDYLSDRWQANGKRHVANIEITYTDGTVYRGAAVSNYLKDRGGSKWGSILDTPSIIDYDWEAAATGGQYNDIRVSKNVSYNGEASLLIRNNLNSAKSDTFQQVGPKLSPEMESGKTYKFSYWEYAVNAGWYAAGYGGRWGNPHYEGTPGTSGWKQRDMTFTVGDNVEDIRFQFDNGTEAMYIDLVEVYEIDENGNRIGNNLVINPSFEVDITAPTEATGVKAVADGNGNTTISFVKASDTEYVYIYEDFEGEANVVAASIGDSVTIPGQETGKEYKVVSVDSLGNESEGVTVAAKVVNIAPKNFMAAGRDRSLSVSWRNPERSDITSITVYDKDGNVVSGENVSLESGACNYIDIGNLSNGTRYIYSIKITYADGTEYTGECISNELNDLGATWFGTPKGTQGLYGWSEGVSGIPHVKMSVTNEVSHSGSASLFVRSNLSGAIAHTYQNFGPDIAGTLTPGAKYRFTFWAKGVNANVYYASYGSRHDAGTESVSDTPGTRDWIQKSFDFVATEDANKLPYFQFDNGYEELYIDDVSVYLLDENGNTTGNNLLINGGLEYNTLSVQAVNNVTAVSKNGVVTVNWTDVPGEGYTDAVNVVVYEEYEGYLNPVKVAPAETGKVVFESDAEEVVVKTVNSQGVEAASETVQVTKLVDPYLYTELDIRDANGEVPEYPDPGSYTVTTTVTNQTAGDDFAPALAAAVYDGDGKLIDVDLQALTIAEGASQKLQVTVEIPNDWENIYTIKVFLWEGLSNMAPVASGYIE